MESKRHPAVAVAPGRIILRELDARGWSQQELAEIMGRPVQMINEIIGARKQITAETALQLAAAFGTSPEFWLNLEMQYQLTRSAIEAQELTIEQRSRLYHMAPVREMIRRAWIRPTRDIEELEREVCQFLGIASIHQQPAQSFRLRASVERGLDDRNVIAWVKRVEQLAAQQVVRPYSHNGSVELVEEILNYAENPADIVKIPPTLMGHGIHFLVVPHLSKTFLDGAALWVANNPVISLTLRYDRIDAFWFTLLHELAHIFLHHGRGFVDERYERGNESDGAEEIEASQTVAGWLLPEAAFQEFIAENRPRFSRRAIVRFATEHKRHPGIVIGQLMYRRELKYSHLREYLVRVSPLLAEWVDVA